MTLTATSFHSPAHGESISRTEIMSLLAAERFDELDRQLTELDDEANAQKRPEADLDRAFRAFATSDPAILAQLDRWVTERPNSGMALVARGVNRFHLVQMTRYSGTFRAAHDDFSQEIKIKQRDAIVDAQKGLAIKEMNPIGFVLSIELFIAWGDPQSVEKWYRIAINDLPASPAIHRIYLSAYAPWNQAALNPQESLARLKEITDSLEKGFSKDPDFAWLRGYFTSTEAEASRLAGHPADAIESFSAALEKADDAEYRIGRARAYLAMGDGNAALDDFSEALALEPDLAPALHGQALAKEKLGNIKEALSVLDHAVTLDPLNPLYLTDRARLLRKLDRNDEARRDIEAALQYGSNDPWVQVWRGAIYEPVSIETANEAFLQAINLEPSEPAYLKRYAEFLLRHDSCTAIDIVERYSEACQAGMMCGDKPRQLESAAMALKSKMSCAE
jgi:tetratricopeptide (TPR) repeat protein